MQHFAWSVAILLSLLASSVLADVAPVAAPVSAILATEEHVCSGAFAPLAWRDASDALFFATGPTSRLDEHEMWAGVLVAAPRRPLPGRHASPPGTRRADPDAAPVHPRRLAPAVAVLLAAAAPEVRICGYGLGLYRPRDASVRPR